MANKVGKNVDDKFVQQKWVITKIHRSFQQNLNFHLNRRILAKTEFSGIEASQSLVPHRRALRANFLSLSGDIYIM